MNRKLIPLKERPLDIAILGFFYLNIVFITYLVDLEQLIISDTGSFTYPLWPPRLVVDLVHWWGSNFDPALKARLCRLLTASVDYALTHREEALEYASRYARGIEDDPERSDRFVGMYVNHWTLDYGDAGRRAVQELLDQGHSAGILPHRVIAEFTDLDS